MLRQNPGVHMFMILLRCANLHHFFKDFFMQELKPQRVTTVLNYQL